LVLKSFQFLNLISCEDEAFFNRKDAKTIETAKNAKKKLLILKNVHDKIYRSGIVEDIPIIKCKGGHGDPPLQVMIEISSPAPGNKFLNGPF